MSGSSTSTTRQACWFPPLGANLARDHFLPRHFTFRGDRLAYSNGIIILSLAAIALVVAFQADVNKLIPCVPGATIVSADSATKATAAIKVDMGSMAMKFSGPVEIIEADAGSKRAVIKADAKEEGGQSNANGTVTNAQSGLCLDAFGAATANGTKVILWSCNGGANQQWTLRS